MLGFLKKLQEKNDQIQQKQIDKAEKGIEILLDDSVSQKDKVMPWVHASSYGRYPAFKIDYVGGHYESPQHKDDIKVTLTPKGLIFSNIQGYILPFENIKDVSMRSSEQIEKDITLTRMLAFGVYSLAMKKKKKVVSTVVLLNCEYNGLEYNVALAGDKAPELYKAVFKILAK